MIKTIAIDKAYHNKLMVLARGQKLGRTIELLIEREYASKNLRKSKTKNQEVAQ